MLNSVPTVYLVYARILCPETRELTLGGVQTYLVSLALTIRELGWKCALVQYGDKDFEDEIRTIPVIGFGVAKSKRSGDFSPLYRRLASQLERSQDIIIWGHIEQAPPTSDIQTISIQHGISFDLVRDQGKDVVFEKLRLGWLQKLRQRQRALATFSRSDHVVCVDYNFQNWYRTFSDRKNDASFNVIPNFTEIPNWKIEDKVQFSKILFARRFTYERGSELMLAAAEKLLAVLPEVCFTFAGEGPFQPKIEKLRLEYPDRVAITKYEPSNSLAFHRKYDIAVIPTIGSEGTSLSLLEAMAAGCAVVCTDVGGMTNIVIDRFNGRMIRPDVDLITTAITETIEETSLTNEMRRFARSTVEHSFSLSIWKKRWKTLLQKIAFEMQTGLEGNE